MHIKFALFAIFTICTLLPMPAHAASTLSREQADAIIELVASFGADVDTIEHVRNALYEESVYQDAVGQKQDGAPFAIAIEVLPPGESPEMPFVPSGVGMDVLLASIAVPPLVEPLTLPNPQEMLGAVLVPGAAALSFAGGVVTSALQLPFAALVERLSDAFLEMGV